MHESKDAILVLNAGSSSIKLSVFAERGGELALELRGAVEELYTAPRVRAHDPAGRVVAEKSWDGAALGHDGAVEYLSDFLEDHLAGRRLIGVGHRVVHGGPEYTTPVRVCAETLKALERFIPLAPGSSRTTCPRWHGCSSVRRISRRSLASTRRSHGMEPRERVGGADQRGAHDRATHATRAGTRVREI
jgi:acetokinase family protein